jgi:oligopeptide transport system permease protein
MRHRRRLPFGVKLAVVVMVAMLVIAAFPQIANPLSPYHCLLARSLETPTWQHPFGFDLQGCDLLGVTLLGTRNSLLVGCGSVAMASVPAILLGAAAGVFGGLVDAIVGRMIDLLMAIPVLLVGLIVLTAFEDRSVLTVATVLAVAVLPLLTRAVRVEARRVSDSQFVEAARSLGAGRSRVMMRHVIPNSLGGLAAMAPVLAAFAIGTEALLTIMGAGLQLPAKSWGIVLTGAAEQLVRAPHLLLPGVMILAMTGSAVGFGEFLRHSGRDEMTY